MSLLLSLKDVARELSVTPLHVLRLIARGRLKGELAGQPPAAVPDQSAGFLRLASPPPPRSLDLERWRILPESLTEYARRGMPDLAMPMNDGRWFADPALERAAQSYENALKASMSAPDNASLQADFERARGGAGAFQMNRQSEVSPAMQEAGGSSIAGMPWNLLTAWAIHTFRKAAEPGIGESGVLANPLQELYATRERYDQWASWAWTRLMERTAASVYGEVVNGTNRQTVIISVTGQQVLAGRQATVTGPNGEAILVPLDARQMALLAF